MKPHAPKDSKINGSGTARLMIAVEKDNAIKLKAEETKQLVSLCRSTDLICSEAIQSTHAFVHKPIETSLIQIGQTYQTLYQHGKTINASFTRALKCKPWLRPHFKTSHETLYDDYLNVFVLRWMIQPGTLPNATKRCIQASLLIDHMEVMAALKHEHILIQQVYMEIERARIVLLQNSRRILDTFLGCQREINYLTELERLKRFFNDEFL